MQKQAPNIPRIAAMVIFAMSCIGILIWLWLSFGGPVHLQPNKFRFKAQFAESPLLVDEADVRISGLNVGKVKSKELMRDGGQLVTMEVDAKYAPIPANSRATLRAKSLLGQIYVELTPGDGEILQEGETLDAPGQIQETVEVDEILGTFDDKTRGYFRGWIRELAKGLKGDPNDPTDDRGEDLNDAIGNLPEFAGSGADLLRILDEQDPALRRLVRNTGIALAAVNEREGQLRQLIGNANNFFGAVASRNDALAETVFIFPTFLEESRLTLDRLQHFATDTRPLVRALTPVARKLRPTLRDLGVLAPHLKDLFRKLDPLIAESDENLPHAARFLRGASPLFSSLHEYLPELNPIISMFNWQQEQVSDFIMNGAGSLGGRLPPLSPNEGPRHYLRQYSATDSRSLGIQTSRPAYDRGLAYPAPNYLKRNRPLGMTESWDCKPGGEQRDPIDTLPPCFIQPPSLWDGNHFPRIDRGDGFNRPKPRGNEGREPARP